jgi:ubiquinone/menaquinone biosynthesis C-methylase UbiE
MHATQRFTDRVANYVRYRPDYPHALLLLLEQQVAHIPTPNILDLACGTGILAHQLLQQSLPVLGVEPNAAMRDAANQLRQQFTGFNCVDGSAEAIPCANSSQDLITIAQAYHWFEPKAAVEEFKRVLKPHGQVAIIWNKRDNTDSFLLAYDDILNRYGLDYAKVSHHSLTDQQISQDFVDFAVHSHQFPHQQQLDWQGFVGRVCSSSYAPKAEHPNYPPMIAALQDLYQAYDRGEGIVFRYLTLCYLCQF